MSWRVVEGDCVEVMAGMDAGSVDAVVCDPPYSLSFMARAWDSHATPAAFQAWCEAWAREALRVLKPGGHLLAFGGTRTSHRLACAVEDAGFEIRDSLIWLYASGFPKSLNVALAIDKAKGASDRGRAVPTASTHLPTGRYVDEKLTPNPVEPYEARSPEAERWEGFGTAMKPAHEPVVVARKPLSGTVAGTVLEHGTGALNIAACRIAGVKPVMERTETVVGANSMAGESTGATSTGETTTEGRWPANVVLSHVEGCKQVGEKRIKPVGATARTEKHGKGQMFGRGPAAHAGYRDEDGLETVEAWECQPGCPVFELDQQSGTSHSPSAYADDPAQGDRSMFGLGGVNHAGEYGDSGGASRFFFAAKASTAERNLGLHGKRNVHPTVKPVELMRWLVRLVTPPGGLVLDPFAGSGTTGIAALREGFSFVGIEREQEYVKIARARIVGDAPLLNMSGEAA